MVNSIKKAVYVLVAVAISAYSYGITVEEAYTAVPHQRTIFDSQKSLLGSEQIQGLHILFGFTDKCLVLRIEGLAAAKNNDITTLNKVVSDYQILIQSFEKIVFPIALRPVQTEVVSAVKQHQHYFAIKSQSQQNAASLSLVLDQDVNQSSQKLRIAYSQLMEIFSTESAINKQAFFDYLCALDFK